MGVYEDLRDSDPEQIAQTPGEQRIAWLEALTSIQDRQLEWNRPHVYAALKYGANARRQIYLNLLLDNQEYRAQIDRIVLEARGPIDEFYP